MKKNLLKIYESFFDDLDKLNQDKVNDEFGDVNRGIYDEHDIILSPDKNPEFFKGLCNMCEYENIPYNKNGFKQKDLDKITLLKANIHSEFSYFKDVTSLDELQYFNNLEMIYSFCFENCPNLKMVNLNIKNIFIYNYAFSFCTSLKEIIIPIKFKNDMHDIFYGIDLTKVNITYI